MIGEQLGAAAFFVEKPLRVEKALEGLVAHRRKTLIVIERLADQFRKLVEVPFRGFFTIQIRVRLSNLDI